MCSPYVLGDTVGPSAQRERERAKKKNRTGTGLTTVDAQNTLCTSSKALYFSIHRVSSIPSGAGFGPSTVCWPLNMTPLELRSTWPKGGGSSRRAKNQGDVLGTQRRERERGRHRHKHRAFFSLLLRCNSLPHGLRLATGPLFPNCAWQSVPRKLSGLAISQGMSHAY